TIGAAPTVTSLNPTAHTAGSAGFTLTVIGTNFGGGVTVQWNGQNRTTSFGSPTLLTAAIPASDVLNPVAANVTVITTDGVSSNAGTFNVAAAPSLGSLSPSFRTATGPAFTLTLSGSDFTNTMTARWNTINLVTTFVAPDTLTAAVPAS